MRERETVNYVSHQHHEYYNDAIAQVPTIELLEDVHSARREETGDESVYRRVANVLFVVSVPVRRRLKEGLRC